MRTVPLGTICQFQYGNSLPASSRDGIGYDVYGSNGVVGSHNEGLTAGATVIIGRKGSVGEVNFSDDSCWPIDTTYYVDSSSTQQNLRWLFYALKNLKLQSLNKATGVPGLNRNDAYRLEIPLPPLEEQKRIAAILDQADDLRRKRQHAIDRLNQLGQAIFYEMFVAFAEEGWPEKSVSDLVDKDRGGMRTGPFGSQLLHSEFVEEGIPVLGIDNAVKNEFRWSQRRYITPQKYNQLQRFRVFPKDILITIMGTCGRCAIVPDDIEIAINTKHLCCISLNQDLCIPEYLHSYFLHHPSAQRYLSAKSKGAIMDGLNMGIVKDLPVILPPIDKQKYFAKILSERGSNIQQANICLENSSSLFSSLQHRAFTGQL